MAKNYSEILALANKNNMGLSNTIKRDYGIPLDYSSIQETYEAALDYAQNSTLAYIGQPIAVGDTLYIVTDEAGGYLKPVGTVPTGDEKSITVTEDGQIALAGFAAAANATLPQKKADGIIEWVTIDAIVEGDGNTKSVVEAADGSAITVTPIHDAATDTYTYILDITFPAVPEYTVTKTDGEGSTTYSLTKDGEVVGEDIVVPDAYDDTALSGRVKSVEDATADHASRIAAVETFFEAAENGEDIVDTLKEIQTYIESDESGATTMAGNIQKNTDAIAALKGDAEGSISDIVDTAIAEQATKDAGTYATQAALAEVKTTAEAAAVKTEVDTALAGKVDNATLDNYYLKTETYSKEAVDELLEGIQAGASESAASVNAKLTEHENTSNNRFANIETKNTEQDNSIKANTDAITAINDSATGILAKAKEDAAAKVQTLGNTVSANSASITQQAEQITGINANITGLSGRITKNETDISTLKTGLSDEVIARQGLATTVSEHTTKISKLEEADTTLDSSIKAVDAKFTDYAKTTEVEAKISEAIEAIDYSSLEDEIAANTSAIEAEETRALAAEEALGNLIAANTTNIATNTTNIAALETAINAVIENEDGTALNSIKELAAWVTEHESEVLPAIKDNADDIAALKGTGEGSVQKIVADAIASIPEIPIATTAIAGIVRASEEIQVNVDGIMSIGTISTDKLVQGSNELVLSGGSATL